MKTMNQVAMAWWAANQGKFESAQRALIQQKIQNLPDEKSIVLSSIELKDPTMYVIIEFFVGYLGIHRFMLGETGMGILELLTGGGCGILWLIDLFTITGKVKKANYNAVMPFL